MLVYSCHDLTAVGAQVISPDELAYSVARLALLLRQVQQLLELGCTGASAGKINRAAGCLLMKLVLIDLTIRNQGCRFRLASEQGIRCRDRGKNEGKGRDERKKEKEEKEDRQKQ